MVNFSLFFLLVPVCHLLENENSAFAGTPVTDWDSTAMAAEYDTFDACASHSTTEGHYHTHGTPGCLMEQVGAWNVFLGALLYVLSSICGCYLLYPPILTVVFCS